MYLLQEIVEDVKLEPSTLKSEPVDLAEEPGICETTTISTSSSTAMEIEETTLDSSDLLEERRNNPILPCIFCSVRVKSSGRKRVRTIICSSESTQSKIQKFATNFQDEKILGDLQLHETIAYHRPCYAAYHSKYVSAMKKIENPQQPGEWHDAREIHKAAFKSFSELIEDEIIEKEKIYFLKDLYATYKSLLIEFGDGFYSTENTSSKISHLGDKILQSYGDRILITASDTPLRKRIVHKIDMNISESELEKALSETADATKLVQAAFEIRNSVKNMRANKLPREVKIEDNLHQEECEIPDLLFEFMCHLIQGPSYQREKFDCTKIKSLCSDIVHLITRSE